jgi:hypothetical protein
VTSYDLLKDDVNVPSKREKHNSFCCVVIAKGGIWIFIAGFGSPKDTDPGGSGSGTQITTGTQTY